MMPMMMDFAMDDIAFAFDAEPMAEMAMMDFAPAPPEERRE